MAAQTRLPPADAAGDDPPRRPRGVDLDLPRVRGVAEVLEEGALVEERSRSHLVTWLRLAIWFVSTIDHSVWDGGLSRKPKRLVLLLCVTGVAALAIWILVCTNPLPFSADQVAEVKFDLKLVHSEEERLERRTSKS